jgi:hypothetical protein
MAGRILYRTRQFWHYLSSSPAYQDIENIKSILQPPLFVLFSGMSQEEQAHSANILKKLLQKGEKNPELLSAALLHDVGKSRFPLRLWERVFIVLAKMVFPQRCRTWGANNSLAPPSGAWRGFFWRLKKPFMVAELHPQWGAEMAAKAGASRRVVSLIRRHQDWLGESPVEEEDRLLAMLQMVDDES